MSTIRWRFWTYPFLSVIDRDRGKIQEREEREEKKMELADGHCHLVADARKHVGREWSDGEGYEWLSEEALEVVVGTCPTVSL